MASAHLKEIVRGGALALFLKVSGAALGFVVSLVLARMLGAHDAGLYFIALSVVTMASIVARLGLDHSTVRSVSRRDALGQYDELMGEMRTALRVGFIASAIAAVAIFLSANLLANSLFNEPDLAPVLRWMALAVIPLTQMYTYAQALNGLKRIVFGQLIDGLLMPLFNLVGILALASAFGPEGAATSLTLATALAALLGWRLWHVSRGRAWQASGHMRWSYIADSAKSFWVSGILNQGVLPLAPPLLLGLWASPADVGVYSIASRIAFVLGFLLLALRPIASAKFAAMEAVGDHEGMRNLHGKIMLLMFAATVVPAAALAIYPDWVLKIFGHEFQYGENVLRVLVFAQVANVVLGVSGYSLLMTGHAALFSKISAASAILVVVLAFALVPSYGMLGMSFAVLAMTFFYQSLSTVFAFRAYSHGR